MAKRKVKLSITMDRELVDWLDEQVKKKVYANRSHAIEKIVWERKEKT